MRPSRTTHRSTDGLVLAVVAVLATLGASAPLAAQRCIFLDDKWNQTLVRYRVNPNFPDRRTTGTRDQQVEFITCGATAWSDQSRANIRLEFDRVSNLVGGNEGDGINNVSWVPDDGFGAIAIALLEGTPVRGMIGFDIVFFDKSGGRNVIWSGPGEPAAREDVFDLRGVATHEFGHAIGLGHLLNEEATMYATSVDQDLPARTLHQDDRACAETLYRPVSFAQPTAVISSVTPESGPAGGGHELVIEGKNFTFESETTLSVGGVMIPRTNFSVETCNRIRILRMPRLTPGLKNIVLNNSFGIVNARAIYRVIGPPQLVAVEPPEGPTTGGIDVTVSGTDLGASAMVSVGGAPLIDARVVDAETITGVLPPAEQPGPVAVRLEQNANVFVLEDGFTYQRYALSVAEATAAPGARGVGVDVVAMTPAELSAVSIALTHDAALELADIVSDDTASAGAEFAAASIDAAADSATFSVVMRSGEAGPTLPAGDAVVVGRLVVDVANDVAVGTRAAVDLVDAVDSDPDTESGLVRADGVSIRPELIDGAVVIGGRTFLRGDANGDTQVNLSDALYVLNFLFTAGPAIACEDAADANDDGVVNLSDGVYTLAYLFQGGPVIPEPFPEAGADATDDGLGCE